MGSKNSPGVLTISNLTHTTKAGTKLQLIDLKGKKYLQVAQRIQWFREEHPDWTIDTEVINSSPEGALVKAKILDEKGRLRASGYRRQTKNDHNDFVEKAETGAIGRALAATGYGTQFCDDFDEQTALADSPITPLGSPANTVVSNKKPTNGSVPNTSGSSSQYKPKFGKFKGIALESIDGQDLQSYVNFLYSKSHSDQKPLSQNAQEFVNEAENFINSQMNNASSDTQLPFTEDDIPF